MFDPPVRVGLIQVVVPHYRVPVFRRLGATPGLHLTVFADPASEGSLKSKFEPVDEFDAEIAPVRRGRFRFSQPAQIEAARSGRFDVIVYAWNARSKELTTALQVARRRGVRTILWGHGYSKHEHWLRRRLRNRLLGRADAALLYNHTARRRLIDEGFEAERLFVALNAIDQSPIVAAKAHWLERPGELDAFRARHDLDPSATAVFISRLEADKGIDVLLRAFRVVADRRPASRLVIIGEGAAEPDVRAQIEALRLGGHVIMPGAIYDDMDLAPYMLSAAACAYPQAIGLSAMHALGYGLPVITSDDGASHNPEFEAVRDGENALLYRHGDPDDFATRVLECFDDPARRQRLADAALATVQGPEGHSLDRMVRGFTDAIAYVRRR